MGEGVRWEMGERWSENSVRGSGMRGGVWSDCLGAYMYVTYVEYQVGRIKVYFEYDLLLHLCTYTWTHSLTSLPSLVPFSWCAS